MFSVVILAILALILFASIGTAILSRPEENADGNPLRVIAGFASVFVIFLILLVGFLSVTTRVEAKQVGVLTTFGKPAEQTYNAGLAWHMPWQKMTQIDATTQTNEYHGDSAIQVILSDKNTAKVSATIRWAVNRENANDVYADFRTNDPTDSLRKAVVSTQFKAALNSTFNSYDATDPESDSPETLAEKVEEVLRSKTDDLVDIKSVTISYIQPDAAVQKKIDALQTQRGATKVAEEKKATATAEAEANRILSESISNDPNVLVSKCLDLIADGSLVPPAGFSCWPGSGGSVVIPSK